MTNIQLYLSIGVPILVNILFNGAMFLLFHQSVQRQFEAVQKLFEAQEKLFSERLLRVEQVLAARLKLIESRLGIA
jgi:hypothetical protein